jgi:hypothetical protein
MWSDAANFYVKGRVVAYENDKLIYDRKVEDTILRNFI